MRGLNKRQEKLLIKWYKEKEPSKEGKMLLGSVNPLRKFEDLATEQIEELERINDNEVLYQAITRFLWDLRFEEVD